MPGTAPPSLTAAQLADVLRDYFNTPRVRTKLEQSGDLFWQALASLDLLGDTGEAIAAHEAANPDTADSGEHYIRLYGLMTAFQLQQDAGTNLAEALGFRASAFDYADLRTVRDARIAIAGHSSRRVSGVDEPTFYFVHRHSLSDGGLQLAVASEKGGFRTEAINLQYLRYLQNRGMSAFLGDLLANAEQEEAGHKMTFAGRSLAALLDGHSYEFEKVGSTGLGGGQPDTVMAPASLRILGNALAEFEAELEVRGLQVKSYIGIAGVWPHILGSLAKLESYFANPATDHLDPLEAYAVAHLLRSEWLELLGMAGEIDAEYATTPADS